MTDFQDFVRRGEAAQRAVDELAACAALDLVNELLVDAPPIGAYCMGMASMACAKRGVRPDRQLMLAMRQALGVLAAEVLLNRWLEARAR